MKILRILTVCSSSEELLAPGGFLNSQTTDTQIFGFSQSSSEDQEPYQPEPLRYASPAACCGTQSYGASNSVGHSTLLPSAAGSDLHPTSLNSNISTDSSRGICTPPQDGPLWRGPRPYLLRPPVSKSYPAHWKALDDILRAWSDGLTFTFQPLLRRRRPNADSISLCWTMDASAEEKAAVIRFVSDCHKIAGDLVDVNDNLAQLPNDIQHEYLHVMDYVARLLPWMMRAVTDSDLVRLKCLIGAMRDLMISIEALVHLEEEAREKALRDCGMV
jgi:hypothetical protein